MQDGHELYMMQQRDLASKLREIDKYMCAEQEWAKNWSWIEQNAVYKYDSASKVGGLLAIQYVNRKTWMQDLKTWVLEDRSKWRPKQVKTQEIGLFSGNGIDKFFVLTFTEHVPKSPSSWVISN